MEEIKLINHKLLDTSSDQSLKSAAVFLLNTLADRIQSRQQKGMEEIEKLATAYGLILPKLYVKNGVAPRYQNPSLPHQTWSGRGRPPVWLVEAEARGEDREKFAIKNPNNVTES
ncbi:H-NS histone family protein [Neisseriaceae bacterium TC5R-5]|nr:H-NS histone family protein [Neisseriaceae bacterium TC5R-5]